MSRLAVEWNVATLAGPARAVFRLDCWRNGDEMRNEGRVAEAIGEAREDRNCLVEAALQACRKAVGRRSDAMAMN